MRCLLKKKKIELSPTEWSNKYGNNCNKSEQHKVIETVIAIDGQINQDIGWE